VFVIFVLETNPSYTGQLESGCGLLGHGHVYNLCTLNLYVTSIQNLKIKTWAFAKAKFDCRTHNI